MKIKLIALIPLLGLWSYLWYHYYTLLEWYFTKTNWIKYQLIVVSLESWFLVSLIMFTVLVVYCLKECEKR